MTGSHLSRLRVRGLMSLRDVTLEPGRVTVVIGPNGAGKSNLLAALRMISSIRTGALWRFLKSDGPPSSLLHNGPKTTDKISIELTFQREGGSNSYCAELAYAADESFIFEREETIWHADNDPEPVIASLGRGHRESRLKNAIEQGNKTAIAVERCLGGLNFFHFHDTSSRSALRTLAPHGIEADCRIVHHPQTGSRPLHRGGGGWPDWKAKIRNALHDTRPGLRFTTLRPLRPARRLSGATRRAEARHGLGQG